MAIGVKVVNRPGSLAQQMYLPAIAEGMGVTFKHFVKNFFGNLVGQRKRTDIATLQYPEELCQFSVLLGQRAGSRAPRGLSRPQALPSTFERP